MSIFDGKQPKDYWECSSEIKERADCVGLICVEGQKFLKGSSFLKTTTMGTYAEGKAPVKYPGLIGGRPLCPELAGLRAVWMVGTAFLVSRSTALTAWHNVQLLLEEIDGATAKDLRVVFGFHAKYSGDTNQTLNICRVNEAEEIQDPKGEKKLDIGLLRLEGNVSTNFLDCAPKDQIKRYQQVDNVEMLGYPYGQILKYTTGSIYENEASTMRARLTGFPGNSGSPVFINGQVVGVYTSANGEDLQLSSGNCLTYRHAKAGESGTVRTLEVAYDANNGNPASRW